MVLGEVAQHLGHRSGVAVGERQSGGPDQECECIRPTQVGCRQTGEGHLVDPELAVGCPQCTAELLLLLDGEPGVLGREHRLGGGEALGYLGDRLDLLRSWHGLLLALSRGPGPRMETLPT